MDQNALQIRSISEDLQNIANVELNEVPNRMQADLDYIREWLNKQPHLKARTDDQWLISFLRGCKYSLEKTKEKLDAFYMMRTIVPEFFKNRDPFLPEIQNILNYGFMFPLPKTAGPTSPTIVYIKNDAFDPSKCTFANLYKVCLMAFDILLMENDNFVISGVHFIDDVSDITVAHYAIPPAILERVMTCLQKIYPLRIKGIDYFNTSSLFEFAFNIMKPFFTKKISERVRVFKQENIEQLYETVPQSLLPNEYGGEAGTVQELSDAWKKKVESYADWFAEDEQYCTNEKLRPGKPKTCDDVFGLAGSFRKLNVD